MRQYKINLNQSRKYGYKLRHHFYYTIENYLIVRYTYIIIILAININCLVKSFLFLQLFIISLTIAESLLNSPICPLNSTLPMVFIILLNGFQRVFCKPQIVGSKYIMFTLTAEDSWHISNQYLFSRDKVTQIVGRYLQLRIFYRIVPQIVGSKQILFSRYKQYLFRAYMAYDRFGIGGGRDTFKVCRIPIML